MIEINNLTTTPINKDFLEKISKLILDEEGEKNLDLSIVLVGQQRMRKLNKRYRGKNRVTDVLSFGPDETKKFVLPPGEPKSGEVVLCTREIKKNAKKFKSLFEKELAVCLIHGILHLLGYNHEKNEKTAKEMEKKQQYYLSKTLKFKL
jgi:probable rRNA maturation factor